MDADSGGLRGLPQIFKNFASWIVDKVNRQRSGLAFAKMRIISLIAPMQELFELFHGRSGRGKRVAAAGNSMTENA